MNQTPKSNEDLEYQQGFLEFIPSIKFIDERGSFNINAFCVYLAEAFEIEGILDASPKPMEIRQLLIDELQTKWSPTEIQRRHRVQKVINWLPKKQPMYPNGNTEILDVGSLLHVYDGWIFEIGQRTPGKLEEGLGLPYLQWAREEWITVHTFIHAFHNQLFSFLKRIDSDSAKEAGRSLFETLHISIKTGVSYDEAAELLRQRNQSYREALIQINAAIDQEFFLEAVTIEECVIANCLWNFAKNTDGAMASSATLHKLIYTAVKLRDQAAVDPGELLSQLDNWRKLRNTAIHGFVTVDGKEFWNGRSDFTQASKNTATLGLELTAATVRWYENEAIHFLKTEFDTSHDSDKTVH